MDVICSWHIRATAEPCKALLRHLGISTHPVQIPQGRSLSFFVMLKTKKWRGRWVLRYAESLGDEKTTIKNGTWANKESQNHPDWKRPLKSLSPTISVLSSTWGQLLSVSCVQSCTARPHCFLKHCHQKTLYQFMPLVYVVVLLNSTKTTSRIFSVALWIHCHYNGSSEVVI